MTARRRRGCLRRRVLVRRATAIGPCRQDDRPARWPRTPRARLRRAVAVASTSADRWGRSSLWRRGALVRVDDVLHDPMPNDVTARQPYEPEAFDVGKHVFESGEPAAATRHVDLSDIAG